MNGHRSAIRPAADAWLALDGTRVEAVSPHPAVLLTELFPPAIGGSAVLLAEIYSRIARHPVTVLTDEAASAGPRSDALAGMRVRTAPLSTPHWGLMAPAGAWHHLRTSATLLRLANIPGAVVHCGRVLPEGLWAWLVRLRSRVPYVCWSHGEDVSSAWTSRELHFLMRRIYRGAAAVLANSHNTAGLLSDLGVDPARVTVVHPGVDTTRFNLDADGAALRRKLGLGDRTVLLTVARIERRKGHDLVLRAMERLRWSHPRLHYVIAGTGGDRPRIEALAAELGLRARVTFAGKISDADLPSYYAASDIFVHPNRIEGSDLEGFGLVFLEAAACGRVSIGGNSGGVPEAVADGLTGLLVGGSDADELAAAVAALADDPARRLRMGKAGAARVQQEFTWERAALSVAGVHAAASRVYGRRR